MVYYSELAYLNRPIENLINTFISYGAERIEFMLDGMYWEDIMSSRSNAIKIMSKHNLSYSIHPAAWDMNLTSESSAIRDATFNHYVDCIRFAYEIGADQVVIHPGFTAPPFSRELAKKRADESLHTLSDIAKPLGVKLALENVGTKKTMIYTESEFEHLTDDFDDHVGLLIDIGHAHITGFDIPRLIDNTKDRLFSVHIHDNKGVFDDHLPIGEGNINFKEIFQSLSYCNCCHLVLEYYSGVDLEKLKQDKNILDKIGR